MASYRHHCHDDGGHVHCGDSGAHVNCGDCSNGGGGVALALPSPHGGDEYVSPDVEHGL
jgi:hypothetical protein